MANVIRFPADRRAGRATPKRAAKGSTANVTSQLMAAAKAMLFLGHSIDPECIVLVAAPGRARDENASPVMRFELPRAWADEKVMSFLASMLIEQGYLEGWRPPLALTPEGVD